MPRDARRRTKIVRDTAMQRKPATMQTWRHPREHAGGREGEDKRGCELQNEYDAHGGERGEGARRTKMRRDGMGWDGMGTRSRQIRVTNGTHVGAWEGGGGEKVGVRWECMEVGEKGI